MSYFFKRQKHIRWQRVAAFVLVLTSCILLHTSPAQATMFGFNYSPAGYGSNALYKNSWPTTRLMMEKDADQMASLGVGVIRFILTTDQSGFILTPGAGGKLTAEYNDIKTNLPLVIGIFQSRGIKVIVDFGNWCVDIKQTYVTNWKSAYGPNGFSAFTADSARWMYGIIEAVQKSPYKSNVLFYNYYGEIRDDPQYLPNAFVFLNSVYDYLAPIVPVGKRGVSPLSVPRDSDALKKNIGSRVYDYIDFHVYPGDPGAPAWGILNDDMPGIYSKLRGQFPGAKVLVGEFGQRSASGTNTEANQTATDTRLINQCTSAGVPYCLNWTLWDSPWTTSTGVDTWGFGSTPDKPKDIMGVFSAKFNKMGNPDMEDYATSAGIASLMPKGWLAGSDVFPTNLLNFSRTYGGQTSAATGNYFARMIVANRNGGQKIWFERTLGVVQGSRNLYLDFYHRGNVTGVHAEIQEYDRYGKLLRTTRSPLVASTLTWSNYLQRAGSWSLPLHRDASGLPDTYSVVMRFVGSISTNAAVNPDIFDLDTVSVYAK